MREQLVELRHIHAMARETIECVCEAWSETDDPAAGLGADGLEEAAEEATTELERFIAARLCELEPGIDRETRARHHEAVRRAAQELYAATLAVGQQLKVGLVHGLPVPSHVDLALAAVGDVLERLEPYVTPTDIAMRRVLLDDESIAVAGARATGSRAVSG